jgi:hypothetical protein
MLQDENPAATTSPTTTTQTYNVSIFNPAVQSIPYTGIVNPDVRYPGSKHKI